MRSVILAIVVCVSSVVVAAAEERQVLSLVINADAAGAMESLSLNGELIEPSVDGKKSRFDLLQTRVRSLVEDADRNRKPNEFVAELEVDEELAYEHVVQVIRAISSYRTKMGDEPIALIKTIKFLPQRTSAK